MLEGSGLTATGSQVQSKTTVRVTPGTARQATTQRTSSGSPAPSNKGKKRATPAKKSTEGVKKKSKLISEEELETAMNEVVAELPKIVDEVKDIDYDNVNLIYQKSSRTV